MAKFSALLLEEALQVLKKGDSILYPTDTVWALGCDAENEAAADKISKLKGFDPNTPMVILVGSLKMLLHYVPQLPPKAGDLIEFYEKPLTILYENSQFLPDKIKAHDGTIAIRLVKEPFCAALVNSFGKAIVSTMACVNKGPIPLTFDDIPADIRKAVDYTVSYKREFKGSAPSTMIRIDSNNELQFLRKEG
jgi:L-threonylcarbamoyladenylate synthase